MAYRLLALQPLPCDSVPRLREHERPDFAQPDLAQRAIAGAIAIEEDLLPQSQTAHAQSRTLGVAAFLAGLHVRDNRGGQGLRFFQCSLRTMPPREKPTYAGAYTESAHKDLQRLAQS